MLRLVLACSGVLICGSLAALFLFVPPLVIAVTWVVTMALLATGYTLLYFLGAPPEGKH